MKIFLRNVIVFVSLLLSAFLFHRCITSGSDEVTENIQSDGNYYYNSRGTRIWINRSFREGSLSGRFRSRGPHAGK